MHSIREWDRCIRVATIDVLQSAIEKRVEEWDDGESCLEDSSAPESYKYVSSSRTVLRVKSALTVGVMVRMQNFFRVRSVHRSVGRSCRIKF